MENKIIPTAEEFFEQGGTYPELAIKFAKLHVEAALKEAAKSLPYNDKMNQSLLDSMAILNSYPLENIK
jgi:hypothetical protein